MSDNAWIEWSGGECPVGGNVCVQFRTRFEVANPDVPIDEDSERRANTCVWRHEGTDDDILRYRVAQHLKQENSNG